MSSKLNEYGFDRLDKKLIAPFAELSPARLVLEERGVYRVVTAEGTCDAIVSGQLRHRAAESSGLPAVGDWVMVDDAAGKGAPRVIRAVLERRSKLSRKAAGGAVEQVLAANVDVAFLVMGLDGDFNLRRLERFLALVRESGARPVVVLNKADLCSEAEDRRLAAENVAPGTTVVVVSALEGQVESIASELVAGETAVFLGSSGVGKSTLINRLCGNDALKTDAVRSGDDRGRHTTTNRQLVRLPGGALLIDTPGIREIQLWDSELGLGEAFEDVKSLAVSCRFRDCTHADEPGCAVLAAVADGTLDGARLENLRALEREQALLAERRDARSRRESERRFGKTARSAMKVKRDRRHGWD